MAKSEINTFTSFILSELETLQGSVLSVPQLQVIQNDMAQVAEQRLNIDLDPKNIVAFAQHEAFLKGQLSAFKTILDRSFAAEKELSIRAQAQDSNQD